MKKKTGFHFLPETYNFTVFRFHIVRYHAKSTRCYSCEHSIYQKTHIPMNVLLISASSLRTSLALEWRDIYNSISFQIISLCLVAIKKSSNVSPNILKAIWFYHRLPKQAVWSTLALLSSCRRVSTAVTRIMILLCTENISSWSIGHYCIGVYTIKWLWFLRWRHA